MAVTWGSIAGSYGRIGIEVTLSNTNTQTTATVKIYFWSKYSVSDSSNTLYFDNSASSGGSASTSRGACTIKTTVASGSGWSESNKVLLKTYTYTYTRGTSAVTRYLYAKLTDIDRVGSTMSVSTTFSVPKLASYTISYNANGGSGAPSSQTKYYGKDLTLSSTKPTRTGYSFQGWGTSASATTVAYASGASYTANSTVTLYAIWKANTYTVSYNANGGSGAPSSQTKTYGVSLTLSSTVPARTNYTFKGWATTASATTPTYASGGSYTANSAVTLYAVWELSYVAPRINSLSVNRCDSSGALSNDRTYALVTFSWATDKTVSSVKIVCNSVTTTVTSSGTSGSVSQIVGKGALSTEKSYSVTVTVTDTNGSSTVIRILGSALYSFDALKGGNGVAFGKIATKENAFDVAWKAYFDSTLHTVGNIYTDENLYVKYLNTNADNAGKVYAHLYSDNAYSHIGCSLINDDGTASSWAGGIYLYPDYSKTNVEFRSTKMIKSSYAVTASVDESSFLVAHGTASADAMYTATRTDTGNSVSFGVGAGGNNRGLFDRTGNGWMIYANSDNNVYVGSNTYAGSLGFYSNTGFYFNTNATTGYAFRPSVDKILSLGLGSYRWTTVYASTTSISSSDRKVKKDFTEFDDAFDKLFDDLKPQRFKFIDGTSDRYHSGYIAQDVEASLEKYNLTSLDFAGFCKDRRTRDIEHENGNVERDVPWDDENGNPYYIYSLRYEEFIALNTWQIQKLKARVAELENKINELTKENN